MPIAGFAYLTKAPDGEITVSNCGAMPELTPNPALTLEIEDAQKVRSKLVVDAPVKPLNAAH